MSDTYECPNCGHQQEIDLLTEHGDEVKCENCNESFTYYSRAVSEELVDEAMGAEDEEEVDADEGDEEDDIVRLEPLELVEDLIDGLTDRAGLELVWGDDRGLADNQLGVRSGSLFRYIITVEKAVEQEDGTWTIQS